MDRYVECVTCEERFAGERAIASFSREVEVDGEVETRCLSCIEKKERNMTTRTKIEAGLKLNIIGEGTTVEVASVEGVLVTFTNGNTLDIRWMECRIGTDSADPVYTVNS